MEKLVTEFNSRKKIVVLVTVRNEKNDAEVVEVVYQLLERLATA